MNIKNFEFIRFLGKGAYGIVWLVKRKATGDFYAMKIVDSADRDTLNRLAALKAEKDIYEVLEGDFVVKAIWTFNHKNFICFVTEYMIGGDFNTFLEDSGRLDEVDARFYFGELVLAIESLHNLGIIHRDLKPENILIDKSGHIRLTDFGLSNRGLNKLRLNTTPTERKTPKMSPVQEASERKPPTPSSNKKLPLSQKANLSCQKTKKIFDCLDNDDNKGDIIHQSLRSKPSPPLNKKSGSKVGTPDYMAPEVLDPEKYDLKDFNEKCIDWWSMGVILYQFLVGIPPFCGESIEEVFDNIANHKMDWPSIGIWEISKAIFKGFFIGYGEDCMTPEAHDLISRLLDRDPKTRLGARGAEEIKSHKFFTSKGKENLNKNLFI